MKKIKISAFIVFYIFMMFFTNSYLRIYRHEEWKNLYAERRDPEHFAKSDVVVFTMFWPVYWAHYPAYYCTVVPAKFLSEKMDNLVKYPPKIHIQYEGKE